MHATTLIAVVALLAAAVAAGPTFTVCNAADSIMSGVTVTSPDQAGWKGGMTVHFTVKGNLASPVEGGMVHSVATYFGTEVENSEKDFCALEGAPITCPVAAGVASWTFPFTVPAVPIAGELVAKSEFKDAGGKLVLCMEMSVQIS
jgi:hypothetical protein